MKPRYPRSAPSQLGPGIVTYRSKQTTPMTTLDSGPASAIQNSVPALSGSRVRLEGPISEPWMEDIGYADTSAGKMESATQRDRRPQGRPHEFTLESR